MSFLKHDELYLGLISLVSGLLYISNTSLLLVNLTVIAVAIVLIIVIAPRYIATAIRSKNYVQIILRLGFVSLAVALTLLLASLPTEFL